jgi:hypothetical protein
MFIIENYFKNLTHEIPDMKERKMSGGRCMKTPNGKAAVMFLAIILTTTCFGQGVPSWDQWSFLIGEWQGEGGGQPGQGGGTFTFFHDLDHHILVRKSHSEYPASGDKPAIVHDDLMIVYPESPGSQMKAVYFDNEGHVINYSVTFPEGAIVLTSQKTENMPVFRLTYTSLDKETVDTNFEMSRDGEHFMTYVRGKSRKMLR